MSFGRLSLAGGFALVLLGVGSLMVGRAQMQSQPQRPLRIQESSGSKGSEVATNLGQLSSKRDGLKQLEDQLTWSFNPFSTKSAIEDEMATQFRPPAAPVMQNRKALSEEIQRRKNWAFTGMEELMLGTADQAASNLPEYWADGRTKNKTSGFEHLYDSLNPQADRGPDTGLSRDNGLSGSRARTGQTDEAGLPGSIKENEQELKKMLASNPNGGLFGWSPIRSSFSDFFGLGQQGLSQQQMLEHRAYMDQYRQLLEGQSAASAGSALTLPGADTSSGQPTASGGLDSLQPAHTAGATPNSLGSLLNPGTLPDANAQLLNQWNPLYTPPKLEQPHPAPISVPVAEVPRRKF